MRIAILGAGATGGFLGARLVKAGADVVLIARGPHLKALRESGLRLIEAGRETTVPVEATDDLAAIQSSDFVFVTLKAHSVPSMAAGLAANLGHEAAVVSAQNGIPWWYFQRHGGELEGTHLETVDPGGMVARTIDPKRVIGCIVYSATTVVGPFSNTTAPQRAARALAAAMRSGPGADPARRANSPSWGVRTTSPVSRPGPVPSEGPRTTAPISSPEPSA